MFADNYATHVLKANSIKPTNQSHFCIMPRVMEPMGRHYNVNWEWWNITLNPKRQNGWKSPQILKDGMSTLKMTGYELVSNFVDLMSIWKEKPRLFKRIKTYLQTGSASSKYEHRRASALLRNIQNIGYGKKPYHFCNLRKWKDFNENSLPYLKCVLRLSCVVHGPIYGRFTVFL